MSRNFQYQKDGQYFAQVSGGLEEASGDELRKAGCKIISDEFRGLIFQCDVEKVFQLNYTARTISRILAPIASFQVKNADDLYRKAIEIPWEVLIYSGKNFALSVQGKSDVIDNSRFALYRVKDAITDRSVNTGMDRPMVARSNPDILVNIYLEKRSVTLSIDTSGESLHKRGYKKATGRAPLAETLAAGIIDYSQWDGEMDLLDPMCGTGTLLTEALMKAANVPAGYFRKSWGFFGMPEFQREKFENWKTGLNKGIREVSSVITGSDIDPEALNAARKNTELIPGGEDLRFRLVDFRKRKQFTDGVLVTNPPYGERIEDSNLVELYRDFGDFLKHNCAASNAYLFTCNLPLLKKVGLRTSFRKPLWNGQLEGRLCRYEIY
ncbi:MAG: class I SAM-dependent RNA methyltransferase [Deltaproteobacteria bacterium]|nr:class I SAM-dependent RNA methyltransferase [Deltaproteobacteria bacterium]